MSLYAFTAAGLKGMRGENWGFKLPVGDDDLRDAVQKHLSDLTDALSDHLGIDLPNVDIPKSTGDRKDSGVQSAIDELLARLSSQAPIDLAGTLELVAPKNGPAIRIIRNSVGDGPPGDGIVDIVIENVVNNTTEVVNTTVVNEGDTTIVNNIATEGFSGSQAVLVDVDVSVSSVASLSGCTVTVVNTVTVTKTFKTITFSSGLVSGVA